MTLDPSFTELASRLARERAHPPTDARVTAGLTALHRAMDRVDLALADPQCPLDPLFETIRTAYTAALLLADQLERWRAAPLGFSSLRDSAGKALEMFGRRLGPRYQAFALECLSNVPEHVILGKRAMA